MKADRLLSAEEQVDLENAAAEEAAEEDEAADAEARRRRRPSSLRQRFSRPPRRRRRVHERSADYEAVLAQSLGQQEELIKEKHDAARLSIRARKATKIARAWVARRIRLEPEKDPLAEAYAERLKQYDEQLKSKDVKEGEKCLFCNEVWRRGHVGPAHWSAQKDYIDNYRPFCVDVACPLGARRPTEARDERRRMCWSTSDARASWSSRCTRWAG